MAHDGGTNTVDKARRAVKHGLYKATWVIKSEDVVYKLRYHTRKSAVITARRHKVGQEVWNTTGGNRSIETRLKKMIPKSIW